MGGQQVTYPRGLFIGLTALLVALLAVILTLPSTVGGGLPRSMTLLIAVPVLALILIVGVSPLFGGVSVAHGSLRVLVGLLFGATIPLDAIREVAREDGDGPADPRYGVRFDRQNRTVHIITSMRGIVVIRLSRPAPARVGMLIPRRFETLRISVHEPDRLMGMVGNGVPPPGGNAG